MERKVGITPVKSPVVVMEVMMVKKSEEWGTMRWYRR
jgi:hypothetical protein